MKKTHENHAYVYKYTLAFVDVMITNKIYKHSEVQEGVVCLVYAHQTRTLVMFLVLEGYPKNELQ